MRARRRRREQGPAAAGSPRAQGFTLLELLVVLTLMTIVAGLAMPVAYRNMSGYRAQTTARELGATFRMARDLAVASRATHWVLFDVENSRYLLARDERVERRLFVPEDEQERVNRARDAGEEPLSGGWPAADGFSPVLEKELETGVVFADLELNQPEENLMPYISFDPRGHTSGAKILVQSRRNSWQVTLSRAGGRVSLRRMRAEKE